MSSQILVRYLYKASFAGTTSAVTTAGKPSESDTLHYQRISVYTHNMGISYTPNKTYLKLQYPEFFYICLPCSPSFVICLLSVYGTFPGCKLFTHLCFTWNCCEKKITLKYYFFLSVNAPTHTSLGIFNTSSYLFISLTFSFTYLTLALN